MIWRTIRSHFKKARLRVYVLSVATMVIFFISSSLDPPRFKRGGASLISTFPWIQRIEIPVMKSQGCVYDRAKLPSAKHSAISVLNHTKTFKLGEFIHVNIHLYNEEKKPMMRGGDLVLIWMVDPQNAASSTGRVTDHRNGSYTGILRTAWTGRAIIKCAIACSREGFELMYKYFEIFGPSKNIWCIFQRSRKREISVGSPSVPIGKRFCNFTAENYGIPWYCVRPKERGVECSDWTKVSHEATNTKRLFENKTTSTYYIRAISHQPFTDRPDITITKDMVTTLQPSVSCNRSIKNTWTWQSPSGFFYNNTWHRTDCIQTSKKSYHLCLQNRRVILYGDSTVRQWFSYLFDFLELGFKTQMWNATNWHRQSVAYQKNYNYQITWTPHGLPIYFGEVNRGETRPIYVSLDEIPPGSNHIILIHLFAHFHYHHPSAFRRNIKRIADSVRTLLVRSPEVQVAIKGPHYFSFRDRKTLGGMWGPVYDGTIKEMFRGLYDKVVFVNIWDMTVARGNRDVHPASALVRSMVNTFLNDVCQL